MPQLDQHFVTDLWPLTSLDNEEVKRTFRDTLVLNDIEFKRLRSCGFPSIFIEIRFGE